MKKECRKCGKKQDFEQWAHFKENGEKVTFCPDCYEQYINNKFPDLEAFAINQFRKKFLIDDVNYHVRTKTQGAINYHNAHVYLKNIKNKTNMSDRKEVSKIKDLDNERCDVLSGINAGASYDAAVVVVGKTSNLVC